tara:strand:+ start:1528 stop:1635 length:108 start_codon:yes stop_codon:yes gene_type:complete
MKTVTFDEYMASLPIERQKRINDRAEKLIKEIAGK